MTKLRCSAVHCEYNNDQYCCLPNIQVGGGCDAKTSGDTCCDSFRERKASGTNCASPYCHPDTQLKVDCTAMKCRYNHDGTCHANAIHINGASAMKRRETACDTFACHSKNC